MDFAQYSENVTRCGSLIGSLDNIIIAVTVSVLMGTGVTSFSREAWSGDYEGHPAGFEVV